jgi:hypothetical protein
MTATQIVTLVIAILGVLHGPLVPAIIKAMGKRGQRT